MSSSSPSPPSPKTEPCSTATSSMTPASAPQFFQLSVNVDCARLNSTSSLLKPNPYVEVIVDGKPPKKTETCKSTYQPHWTDSLTLLVTPYSKILFRLYDHSAFKKDSLLGEASVELYGILVKHDGRLSRLTRSLDLKSSGSESRKDSGHKNGHTTNGESVSHKSGELVVVFDGLSIDMTLIPVASPPVAVSVVPSAYDPLIAAAVVANGEAPAMLSATTASQGKQQDWLFRRRKIDDIALKLYYISDTTWLINLSRCLICVRNNYKMVRSDRIESWSYCLLKTNPNTPPPAWLTWNIVGYGNCLMSVTWDFG